MSLNLMNLHPMGLKWDTIDKPLVSLSNRGLLNMTTTLRTSIQAQAIMMLNDEKSRLVKGRALGTVAHAVVATRKTARLSNALNADSVGVCLE
jgi:hypothetical protein